MNLFTFLMLPTATPTAIPTRAICRASIPESSKGLVTDVCLKRKIRNFVEISSENEAGYEIYVKEKSVLNLQNKRAYEALGIESEAKKTTKRRSQSPRHYRLDV